MIKTKLHTSIDTLPIATFNKVSRLGELNLLQISGIFKASQKELEGAWIRIYNEYLQLFKVPDNYKRYVALKAEAGEAFADSLEEGQIWKRSLYHVLNNQAEALMTKGDIIEFEQILAKTSIKVGFRLDSNIITVREFHAFLNA